MKNFVFLCMYVVAIQGCVAQNDTLSIKLGGFRKPSFNLHLNTVKLSDAILSVYNPGLKTNDIYVMRNDSVAYIKSNLDLNNISRGAKIDSFNPYGVSDAKSGLIMGALGEFFSLIFR